MNKPVTITVKRLRPNLSEVISKVEFDRIPHIITRFGEPVAMLTPIKKEGK